MTSDPINPSHYKQGSVECIDAIEAALGPEAFVDFLRGKIMKYIWRYHLTGDEQENARKLQWYADRMVMTQKKIDGIQSELEFMGAEEWHSLNS